MMKKDDNSQGQMLSMVTPSPVMVPPTYHEMIRRRDYPVLQEPPFAHARTWYDPDAHRAGLTYNGFDVLLVDFPEDASPKMRYHSDGDFCSAPFHQQLALSCAQETPARVTLRAPGELWNLRPRRARAGEAILGQLGYPLLYGVNGMYLPDWDLLLSWYGCTFAWQTRDIQQTAEGFSASMQVTLGPTPWVVLLQPRYYGEHLGFAEHEPWRFRPNPRAISGWCSWEAYHSDVTQADLENAAAALQPLRPYGLSVMQLDDGYQQLLVPLDAEHTVNDSWLQLNEKFPDGHAGIVDAMRGGGFEAGIWTNATLTNREACEALDICLRDADGALILGDWIRYVLTCTPEVLATHTTPYYRAFREAGYTYYKSDSLRHLLFDGLQEAVRMGLMDNRTARDKQRAYMRAARAGMGEEAYYLSCWGVLSSSIGVCDAMRVGTDSNPSWGAFSMQLRETARWYFAHRVLFTLDPDVVCVRGPLPWARMLLSLVSLSGGLMMISDAPERYDEERLALIRRTLPGLTVRTAETGALDYTSPACVSIPAGMGEDEGSFAISHIADTQAPFSSLWCTHFSQGGRHWSVAQRCAVVPLDAIDLDLSALSLDPGKTYAAFDFWGQTRVPVAQGRLSLPALALGDTSVISLVELTDDMPALLGSDRHVSMDAVSVTQMEASAERAALTLAGFAGLTVRYALYAPRLAGRVAQAEGCDIQTETRDGLLWLTVQFQTATAFVEVF